MSIETEADKAAALEVIDAGMEYLIHKNRAIGYTLGSQAERKAADDKAFARLRNALETWYHEERS